MLKFWIVLALVALAASLPSRRKRQVANSKPELPCVPPTKDTAKQQATPPGNDGHLEPSTDLLSSDSKNGANSETNDKASNLEHAGNADSPNNQKDPAGQPNSNSTSKVPDRSNQSDKPSDKPNQMNDPKPDLTTRPVEGKQEKPVVGNIPNAQGQQKPVNDQEPDDQSDNSNQASDADQTEGADERDELDETNAAIKPNKDALDQNETPNAGKQNQLANPSSPDNPNMEPNPNDKPGPADSAEKVDEDDQSESIDQDNDDAKQAEEPNQSGNLGNGKQNQATNSNGGNTISNGAADQSNKGSSKQGTPQDSKHDPTSEVNNIQDDADDSLNDADQAINADQSDHNVKPKPGPEPNKQDRPPAVSNGRNPPQSKPNDIQDDESLNGVDDPFQEDDADQADVVPAQEISRPGQNSGQKHKPTTDGHNPHSAPNSFQDDNQADDVLNGIVDPFQTDDTEQPNIPAQGIKASKQGQQPSQSGRPTVSEGNNPLRNPRVQDNNVNQADSSLDNDFDQAIDTDQPAAPNQGARPGQKPNQQSRPTADPQSKPSNLHDDELDAVNKINANKPGLHIARPNYTYIIRSTAFGDNANYDGLVHHLLEVLIKVHLIDRRNAAFVLAKLGIQGKNSLKGLEKVFKKLTPDSPAMPQYKLESFYLRGHPVATTRLYAALTQLNEGMGADYFVKALIAFILETKVLTAKQATDLATKYGIKITVVEKKAPKDHPVDLSYVPSDGGISSHPDKLPLFIISILRTLANKHIISVETGSNILATFGVNVISKFSGKPITSPTQLKVSGQPQSKAKFINVLYRIIKFNERAKKAKTLSHVTKALLELAIDNFALNSVEAIKLAQTFGIKITVQHFQKSQDAPIFDLPIPDSKEMPEPESPEIDEDDDSVDQDTNEDANADTDADADADANPDSAPTDADEESTDPALQTGYPPINADEFPIDADAPETTSRPGHAFHSKTTYTVTIIRVNPKADIDKAVKALIQDATVEHLLSNSYSPSTTKLPKISGDAEATEKFLAALTKLLQEEKSGGKPKNYFQLQLIKALLELLLDNGKVSAKAARDTAAAKGINVQIKSVTRIAKHDSTQGAVHRPALFFPNRDDVESTSEMFLRRLG